MKKVFEILTMIAVIIWGAVFLYFSFSNRVDDYVTDFFRILVPVAGFGMIALGLVNLLTINKSTGVCSHDHAHGDHTHCEHDHDHHDDHEHKHGEDCDHGDSCDHDHHHHHGDEETHEPHFHDEATPSSLAFALIVLLVPLLMAARYSPDSYSLAYTDKWAKIVSNMQSKRQKDANAKKVAANENPYADPEGTGEGSEGDAPKEEGGDEWGKFTLEDLKKMVPQSSAGDFLLDVPQIFYTAGDTELMEVMEGISIETTAQVIEDTFEDSPPNRLRAYRLLIECCAADARPLSIPIDFAEALPEYKEMGWYRLIGRLHFHKTEDQEYVPILQIKTFEETPEPADWMSIY